MYSVLVLVLVLLFAFVSGFVFVSYQETFVSILTDVQEGRSGGGRKMAAEKKEDSADEK